MTPERWAIVKGIFAAARKAPRRDRAAIVESLCDGDVEIKTQAQALLDADDAMPEMDTPSRLLGLPQTDSEKLIDGASTVTPERVGSYSVLRLVGSGRSGAVYEAMQPKTRRAVALKVVRLGRTGAQALQRFEFEATALARLSHTGIAQIYEAGVDTNSGEARPFLAMEMVSGARITEYVNRENLDLRSRIRLVVQVCEAVQHAHERGIVHLDLKPANILVSSEGQPKIVDFGVAMISDLPEGAQPTERGGTIPYMSPEQLSGRSNEIDLRSDVYALGVLLYELIEGKLPREIAGRSYVEAILRAKAGGGFAWAGKSKPGVDEDLKQIVLRATKASPDERYQSALELGLDLRRYLEGFPVSARKATAIYVAGRFVKRRRGASAAIALGALGLLAMAGWSVWSGRRARDDAAVARELVTLVLNEEVARIADTQGTQEARRAWIAHVRPGVMQLLSRHPRDAGTALVAARLLMLESDVEHESARIDDALRLRLAALKIRQSAALADQTDERTLMDFSINLAKAGDVFLDRGYVQEGRSFYERALSIDKELAARPGASDEAIDNLSWSYERRRRFAATTEENRELAEKKLALAKELVQRDPRRAISRYNLACAEISLADFAASPAEKEPHLRSALQEAQVAMGINSESRSSYRAFIVAMRRMAELKAGDAPDDETRQLIDEMVALAESFRSSERRDLGLCSAVLHAEMAAAEILIRWGYRDEAIDLSHRVEALLPDYDIALAGRPDEEGIRARYHSLAESLAK
ncbi:MAG: serine/threonine protein kinase [Phycisphaeraceae bacterium]|nr:serine/threonine protein kinase [Phycisphaeraceae bacterium]